MPAELLIRGGTIIDGTGAPAFLGDVLVSGSQIVGVERAGVLCESSRAVLDAHALVIAPGFIDVHSHADNAPLLEPPDTSKILQGVTTEIVGNCGFSLAPHHDDTGRQLESYSGRLFPTLSWAWQDFGQLFEITDARGYVTNYAPLAGQHALRIAALGMSDAVAGPAELSLMGRLLDQALEAGVFGLSSGLGYPPGMFAPTAELVSLAQHLPPNRPYVTHLRNEGARLLPALAEAVDVGRRASRRVHISHLKSAGKQNWGKMAEALAALDAARAAGVDVGQDVYPYTAGSTMLTAMLPDWLQDGGESALLQRLEDPAVIDRLKAQFAYDDSWNNRALSTGWDNIVVSSTADHDHEGSSLAQIAEAMSLDHVDALVTLLLQEELRATMVVHSMHEQDLVLALRHEQTMIGSDGLPPGVGGKPHPRTCGTFPRVLARYSRELEVLNLVEAVRRMTSLPARSFGLPDRGVLAKGMAADIVAFDPQTVQDRADYQNPSEGPAGIKFVMVNGKISAENGKFLGRRDGIRLQPPD